jgi:hypothetical protein
MKKPQYIHNFKLAIKYLKFTLQLKIMNSIKFKYNNNI